MICNKGFKALWIKLQLRGICIHGRNKSRLQCSHVIFRALNLLLGWKSVEMSLKHHIWSAANQENTELLAFNALTRAHVKGFLQVPQSASLKSPISVI